jgi:hypothetical protein
MSVKVSSKPETGIRRRWSAATEPFRAESAGAQNLRYIYQSERKKQQKARPARKFIFERGKAADVSKGRVH